MGGHRQPRVLRDIQPGQDKHGTYALACDELADALGWSPEVVRFWWSQLSLCREMCSDEPRAVAEFLAMRDVRLIFDKRGEQGD